ncbi:hypothetical protein ACFVIM_30815 [Streptomyces sp. NPDC057638]|uniref:hypothetical protein n=1 Tax=Streptomyces sp. NPDC057638 TaxID=3346190 RepID=UPI0036C7030D
MTSTAENPVDAALIGTVGTSGTVTPLAGDALAVRHDDRLELHRRAALLAGDPTPVRTHPLPPHTTAAALTEGAVVCEATRIRRIGPDGTTLWETPHAPWPSGHQEPRPPGPPAVSPDGSAVSVLVPTAGDDGPRRDGPTALGHRGDALLLLDTDSGRVLAHRPISGNTAVVTQRWHHGGALLAVSCWTPWYSWSTWWIEPRQDGLHVRGGTTMREVIGFLPEGGTDTRVLTLRRAERIAANDDRDELAAHDVHTDEPTAVLDLGLLGNGRAGDEFDGAFLLDERHLLVAGRIFPPGCSAVVRHWLCDARTLRPLGRVRYPRPVGWVTPLGDGTWLTRSPDGLHHWSLPRRR